MYDPEAPLLTLSDLQEAYDIVRQAPSDQCVRTRLSRADRLFKDTEDGKAGELYLKEENTQITGSFKVRGAVNLLRHVPEGYGTDAHRLITMSAGNFGKAFAYLTSKQSLQGLVLMPKTAPNNRETLIKSYGVDVLRFPTPELLPKVNNFCEKDGMLFLHPFDDIRLIAGHASAGLEILEDLPDPDIVLVCCGGGGLVSGIASAMKLSGHDKCRVYAVEPEGSRTMYESFKAGRPVTMEVGSVASGLSPNFTGSNCYRHCRHFLEDVLLVSDREILDAMFYLRRSGYDVEPSGSAAFAALRTGKVPDAEGRKVVVVLTGSNVTSEELEVLERA